MVGTYGVAASTERSGNIEPSVRCKRNLALARAARTVEQEEYARILDAQCNVCATPNSGPKIRRGGIATRERQHNSDEQKRTSEFHDEPSIVLPRPTHATRRYFRDKRGC